MDPMTPEQNEAATPSYKIVVPSPHTRKQVLKAVVVAVLVLVVVFVALAASYFFIPSVRSSIAEAKTILSFPQELRSAAFVSPPPSQHYFHIKGLRLVPADNEARAGDVSNSPSGNFRVYSLPKTFASSTSIKIPNASDTSGSDVFIRFIGSTRPPAKLGEGISPFVLDAAHVLRFTPTGIIVVDLASGAQTKVHAEQLDRISDARLSPDRSHVMWTNLVTGVTTIGTVTPTSFTESGTITDHLFSPTLGNKGLYDVRGGDQGSEVWEYPLSGGIAKHLGTLSATYSIWSIAL